jgi:hypothetical protein
VFRAPKGGVTTRIPGCFALGSGVLLADVGCAKRGLPSARNQERSAAGSGPIQGNTRRG